MKKKLIIFTLILSLVLSLMPTAVMAADEDVEIRFSIGDDTLLINGNKVTVTRPYAVGAGVTLVPVRVITEAFGAKVDWENKTKTATLNYPEVNIILQIGNPVAEVNGKAETLLAPPEISNGFTMVPLRFISENFGATVSYDNSTKAVVVTKGKTTQSGTTVQGTEKKARVGDSYFSWSIDNPVEMTMEDRVFDGSYTSFVYNEENFIEIFVSPIDSEFDFEMEFQSAKALVQGKTLVRADKDTTNTRVKSLIVHAKDKSGYLAIHEFATLDYLYTAIGFFTDDKIREKNIPVLESFKEGFDADTFDLSTAKDGFRKFEDEDMNISFNIPEDYMMLSDEDSQNKFTFIRRTTDDTYSHIILNIFSKDTKNGITAKELAAYDYKRNKESLNEEITSFLTDVQEKTYSNLTTYTYSYTYDTNVVDMFVRDTFFEVGDYVYNISVSVKLPRANADEIIVSKILNSINAGPIDSSKVGTMLYDLEEIEGTYLFDDLLKCEIQIPKNFSYILNSNKSATFLSDTGIILAVTVANDKKYKMDDVLQILREWIDQQKEVEEITVLKDHEKVKIGGCEYYKVLVKNKNEDNEVSYMELYLTAQNGYGYTFVAGYSELIYSEAAREKIESIIKSIEYQK